MINDYHKAIKIGHGLIRGIGVFLVTRGIWVLCKDFRAALFTFRLYPNRVDQWGVSVVALILISSFVVPLVYILGGAGMVFLRKWARILSFFGLWFSVLFSLTAIISSWYFQIVAHIRPLIARSSADPVLGVMISSYLIALIEVAIIIFLMRPKVREQFS